MAATETVDRVATADWREPRPERRLPPGPSRAAGVAGRPAVVVGAMAALAAAWAAVASRLLFPYLTVDYDEAVYLLQADTLRHGRLFPPAPGGGVSDAFMPWLSSLVGHHYVPKYTPVWPAFIALARRLTGTDRTAIAFVAAAVIVVTYLLGREVLGSARRGMVAAAFMLLSPLFLMQSVSFLSYVPNLLLLETFAVALLSGVRLGSRWRLAAAGLCAGLALFARPFDAVLVGVPFAAWLVWEHRRAVTTLLARIGWIALGAAPVVAAVLAFFAAATGNPLRSPFTLTSASDAPGFGVRRIYASDPGVAYGAEQAWKGFVGHVTLLSFWAFGGFVLIGLAVVALARHSTSRERFLGVIALTVPIGYVFFWGSYIISRWDGPWHVGPFYYLPVLVPLAILGAKGLARLWAWERGMAVLALVAMTAVSGFVLVRTMVTQSAVRTEDAALHEPLARAHLDHAVVFLPSLGLDHLLAPFVEARNATLDGKVLWALDHGIENIDVAERFPARAPYVYTVPDDQAPPSLRRLHMAQGPALHLRIALAPPPFAGPAPVGPVAVRVVFHGRVDTFVLAPGASGRLEGALALDPATTALTGVPVAAHTIDRATRDDVPGIALLPASSATDLSPDAPDLGWVELEARVRNGVVDALVPDAPIVDGRLSVGAG